MATYLRSVTVLLPPGKVATPSLLSGILQHAVVDAAVLLPRNLDVLVKDATTLELLRSLHCISYAGAILPPQTGNLLASHTKVFPAVGSTDAGMYFIEINHTHQDYEYVAFQPHAGIVMEHRLDELYELVFVRTPGAIQPVFGAFPHLDKFYTSDLWSEHPDPANKGEWKIVGRTDDLLKLTNNVGLYVAGLEPIIAEHPAVRSALIGGTGKSSPILIVEPLYEKLPEAEDNNSDVRNDFLKSLRPYVERVNANCTGLVRLDPDFILLTTRDKPFPRTMKETVARLQALRLYDKEIEAAYAARGSV